MQQLVRRQVETQLRRELESRESRAAATISRGRFPLGPWARWR